MAYQGGNRRYSNGGGQRYGGGNGHRPRRPQAGYQGQGDHEPNRASLRPNNDKRQDSDRDLMGVVTITEPGVYFISAWEKQYDDGNFAISLSFAHADPDIRERQKRDAEDWRARNGKGGRGGNRGRPQQRQRQDYNGGYEDNRAYQEGGAMTRARPIPQARYNDNGPYDGATLSKPDDYNVSYSDDVVPGY